jgi:hypothetical protein
MDFTDSIKYIEIASLITSVFYFKKYKSHFYIFFILYIIFAIVADFVGSLFEGENNYWVYDIYIFFEFGSLVGFYYSLIEKTKTKKTIIYLSLLFYLVCFLGFKYPVLLRFAPIFSPFFVIPFIFFYLKELLYSRKIINYKKILPFWLSVALLIFYLGTLPFFSLLYLGNLDGRFLFNVVVFIVMIMHFIFITSLIWSKPIQKQF